MLSQKRSPWDYVIKLRDNWIFKALLVNDLNNWKISYHFSHIFELQKIVRNFDKMLPKGNFERQFEILNAS